MVQYLKLVCILFSALFINMTMVLIAPEFPLIAKSRGINEMLIGLIFTMAPLLSCASSPLIGSKLEVLGKRNTAVIGLLLTALSLLGLTFINTLSNTGFVLLALISRTIGGVGIACIYISSLSLISSEYSKDRESYTSMLEAFGGLGLMAGPIYSSLLSSDLGFSGCFFVLGGLITLFMPVYWIFTAPSSAALPRPKKENAMKAQMKLSRNLCIDLGILAYCYAVLCFLEPTISIYLSGQGLGETSIGLVFAGMTLAYTATNFMMAWLTKYFKAEKMVPVSVLACVIGILFAGPVADMLGLVELCVFGVILTGCGVAISFVSVLPSLLSHATRTGMCEKEVYGDLSSYFSMGMNFGEIIGPVLSGILMVLLGFNSSCVVLAGAGLVLLLGYFMKNKDYSKIEMLLQDYEIEKI